MFTQDEKMTITLEITPSEICYEIMDFKSSTNGSALEYVEHVADVLLKYNLLNDNGTKVAIELKKNLEFGF